MSIIWGIGYALFMIIHTVGIIVDSDYKDSFISQAFSILIPLVLVVYVIIGGDV